MNSLDHDIIFFRTTRTIPDCLCENIKNEPDSGLIADNIFKSKDHAAAGAPDEG
ncbi:MAG: hypothetical protein QM232_03090 [Bacteroidota bacterium]|nr:hypothetical protein [Bacteroidota bacterium]